ncbi:hypothetical protein [Vibrio parahaemolyticus]|uniref:hypothetical protein n=1 Tax=Vibrio parahaemolyticus TaxID=670 RepID=UPI00235DD583|nr:hypothetical protein [Vibrio parahaemolyticus]
MAESYNLVFTAAQIVELAKIFAWPATTIILALVFRNKISSAFNGFFQKNNVTELSTPVGTLKFSQTESAVELQAESSNVEMTKDYESVVKYQNENESKYTRALLKNYQLYRQSYNVSDATALVTAEKALAITVAHNVYGNINRMIYKSQLVYLQKMYKQDSNIVSIEDLEQYYSSVRPHSPLFENVTSEQYVSFLIGQGLVQVSGTNYELTDFGESYVEYMNKYPNLVLSLNQS